MKRQKKKLTEAHEVTDAVVEALEKHALRVDDVIYRMMNWVRCDSGLDGNQDDHRPVFDAVETACAALSVVRDHLAREAALYRSVYQVVVDKDCATVS